MISIRNLSKAFAGNSVLEDVSLDIYEGETLAIIGRSGAGKSVLMKHAVGLLRPDAGQVTVDDVDLFNISYPKLRRIRRQFGVLFKAAPYLTRWMPSKI